MNVLAVNELTAYLRELLDEDALLQDLWIRGEVSNFSRSSAGHCYFTLKDEQCQLRCVLFRGNARGLAFLPGNGDGLLAHGRVTLYEARGEYQLLVDLVQPAGVGPLQLAFEELRHRLANEGLFQEERKRPLPAMPRCIGVVTSASGAVWHDIQTVIARRFPLAELLLAPALVQGADAPASIVAALQCLRAEERVEVIIVARGGGSLEDLWAFNDERVARAIFAARVPVISGVGHEVDVTIADLVADLRAPTPSAAAELCVPDRRELAGRVGEARQRAWSLIEETLRGRREALIRVERDLARASPARSVARERQRLDELTQRAERALAHHRQLRRQVVLRLERQLAALDPRAVLTRGYALVEDAESGTPIVSATTPRAGQALRVTMADGAFEALVEGVVGGRSRQSSVAGHR